MPPARGHTVRRRPHPESPPPRDGGKDSPSCFAPRKIPASSPPRSRKSPACQPLDCLFEGVARAEGGNLLGRDVHLLPGLGVPALPGLALPHGELPEARYPDLLASFKRFGHYLLEGLEVLLSLALGCPGLLGDPLDKFLLLNGRSFLRLSRASWQACLGCLLPVYTGAATPCHPPLPADLAERKLWGCTSHC